MLLGIAWELYVAMPLRYGVETATPVLHIWEAWYVAPSPLWRRSLGARRLTNRSMGMVAVFAHVAFKEDADRALTLRGRRGDVEWRVRAVRALLSRIRQRQKLTM